MLIKAIARNVRMSPRKVRVLATVVKNTNVADTLTRLAHIDRAASLPLIKLISSAAANALNVHKIAASALTIKNIEVNGAGAFKRFNPVSRGAAHSYKKRNSHITVVLEG
jgi:large subunit ribosomal protein L22